MAKTANELLSGILKTVSNINTKLDGDKKSKKSTASDDIKDSVKDNVKDALNISSALLKFTKVKPETTKSFITFLNDVMKVAEDSKGGKNFKIFSEGMISISNSLPEMAKGLNDLGKMKTKRVDAALGTMKKLYMLMYELGDGRHARKIERSIRLFDKLGRALRKMTAPLRILSNFLTYLGLSFVVFAVSIVAAGAILKLSTKTKDEKGGGLLLPIVGVVLGTVAVLVGILVLLTVARKFLTPGLKVIKGIGKGLLMLSLGILGFTLSLLLIASAMHAGLGFGGIMKSLGILAGIIVGVVGLFALLGVAGKVVRKGVLSTALIGLGLTIMALSMAFLVTTAAGISAMIGPVGGLGGEKVKFLGKEVPPIVRGLGTIGMIFIGAAALFALLGTKDVAKRIAVGTLVAMLVSVGISAVAFSMIFLASAAAQVGSIMKGGEKEKSMTFLGQEVPSGIVGLGTIGFMFMGAAGLFGLLGRKNIAKSVAVGTLVAMLVSAGISAVAFSMIFLAKAAAQVGSLLQKGERAKPMKFLGKEVSPAVASLGTIGLLFLGAAGLFALLGLPGVNIIVGTGIALSLGVSASLLLLAKATKELVAVSKNIPDDFGDNLETMISGLLQGTIGGISKGLTGKAERGGGRKLFAALKNTAILMGGLGMLFSVSLTLSMFAKTLTAFAELDNMKVIKGYDEAGKPIFGEKIDISQVSQNINKTISTFLISLIESTTGLSRRQAGSIKKMGKALTGKRGILSAVIQFADALKIYAEFGESNEIGYVDFDDKGNEVRKKIAAKVVVDNMISSFLYFTNKLFSRSEEEFGDGEPGMTGRQKRRMKRMSKALTGKHGILGAVMTFAETLKTFSEFGVNNELPIIGDDGKPTGKYLSVGEIADNIVTTLTTFSDTLADKLEKGKVKDASKALKKYDTMIDRLSKLSSSMDGLSKMSISIKELAEGIGLLGTNLDKLNIDKLSDLVGILSKKLTALNKGDDLGNVSTGYLEKTNDFAVSNKRIINKTSEAATRPIYSPIDKGRTYKSDISPPASINKKEMVSTSKYSEIRAGKEPKPTNWEEVSQMIGDQVGARVSASLKNGQFTFEFDTTKAGGTYFWSPR